MDISEEIREQFSELQTVWRGDLLDELFGSFVDDYRVLCACLVS